MKTFREFILEANDDKVIYVKSTYPELWITYAQGSGTTIQLPNINKFLNSDPSDKEHFDSSVERLWKWAGTAKSIKAKTKLFEIPVYESVKMGLKYDIWGGDIKPVSKIYMLIRKEKSIIVNFFKTKNEALGFVGSIVENSSKIESMTDSLYNATEQGDKKFDMEFFNFLMSELDDQNIDFSDSTPDELIDKLSSKQIEKAYKLFSSKFKKLF